MKFLKSRKFKIGAYGAAVTAVILLIVLAVNYISVLLTVRKDAFIDLTAEKAFELSQEARDVFASIDDSIRVTVLYSKEAYETYLKLLSELPYHKERFKK